MGVNNKYKEKNNKRIKQIMQDDRYMDCIEYIYRLVNRQFTDKNVINDISKSIISKNLISYKNTIWYYDGKRDIGIEYRTCEILWDK